MVQIVSQANELLLVIYAYLTTFRLAVQMLIICFYLDFFNISNESLVILCSQQIGTGG